MDNFDLKKYLVENNHRVVVEDAIQSQQPRGRARSQAKKEGNTINKYRSKHKLSPPATATKE